MKTLFRRRASTPRPDSTAGKTEITAEMIVKDVTARWPQTIAVFGNHRVDFCCGGAHSIEQTARARGCRDVAALLRDLNTAIR
jgi:iron-sulfur cluster repair protein YtfE (RIC family)